MSHNNASGPPTPAPGAGDLNGPQGLRPLMSQFLEWMRVKNYSEKTVANRVVFLDAFIAWAHERGLRSPTEVSKAVLERYQRYLYHYRKKDGDPMSFRSQHTRLLAVRRPVQKAAPT